MVRGKTVKYVCTACGATDSPTFMEHERALPVINCWKCHAGQGKPVEYCLANSVGMFPEK